MPWRPIPRQAGDGGGIFVQARMTSSRRRTMAFYDRLSRWYDLLAAGSELPLARAGLALLAVRPGERVLEIGCGTGHALQALRAAVGQTGMVTGLDLAGGMLAVAGRRLARAGLPGRVLLTQADGTELPFGEAAFDALFMAFVLELFPPGEMSLVLAACRRVLTPGGRMAVVAMARREPQTLAGWGYERLHQRWPQYVDCRPIAAGALLDQAGFQVLQAVPASTWGLAVDVCLAARRSG